ncbi:hypothetical protein XHV734_0709 [Xanthomonas hortorum pv. vitians]|nr:hypothetical protein XHV734_0709 [Xanthomonas hortorum pv. vitians]
MWAWAQAVMSLPSLSRLRWRRGVNMRMTGVALAHSTKVAPRSRCAAAIIALLPFPLCCPCPTNASCTRRCANAWFLPRPLPP